MGRLLEILRCPLFTDVIHVEKPNLSVRNTARRIASSVSCTVAAVRLGSRHALDDPQNLWRFGWRLWTSLPESRTGKHLSNVEQ